MTRKKLLCSAKMALLALFCLLYAEANAVNGTYHTARDVHGVIWYFDVVDGKAKIVGWKNTETQTGLDENGLPYSEEVLYPTADKKLVVPVSVVSESDNISYVVTSIASTGMDDTELANMQIEEFSFENGSNAIMQPSLFKNAASLTRVLLDNYVGNNIPDYCFQGTSGLIYIGVNNGLTSIGKDAFQASGLQSIDLSSSSLTTIGYNAFGGCRSLSSVKFPTSLSTIGDLCFRYCGVLTSIDFSSTQVKSIPSECFFYCASMKDVKLNDQITSIEGSAFRDCRVLETIEMPASLTSIGNTAFQTCKALKKVVFKGSTPPTFTVNSFYATSANPLFYVPVDCGKGYKDKLKAVDVKVGASTSIPATDQVREQLTMSKYGYMSYYLENEDFVVPAGTNAYVVIGKKTANGKLHADLQTYPAGKAVPAKTGFVLEALNNKSQVIDYEVDKTDVEVSVSGTSLMKGTAVEQTFSGENGTYYVLSSNPDGSGEIGFFYQKGQGGNAMTLKAHQAGLFIPKGTEAPAGIFTFGSDIYTGIDEPQDVTSGNAVSGEIHDLQGRKVTRPVAGIYIVNGKKVLIK